MTYDTKASAFGLVIMTFFIGTPLVLATTNEDLNLADIFTGESALISQNPAEYDPNGTLTAINATMNNYTNTEYNFTLLMPADWEQVDPGYTTVGLHTTNFLGPETDTGSKPTFRVSVYTTESYLDTDTMTLKNHTLEEYANADIQELENIQYTESGRELGLNSIITRSESRGDTWRIEFTANAGSRQITFDVLVLVKNPQSGLLYKLDANSPILVAPQTLPIINKIIESFRFL
jgi:hypothetical protein